MMDSGGALQIDFLGTPNSDFRTPKACVSPPEGIRGVAGAFGRTAIGENNESTPMKNHWERRLFYLWIPALMGDPFTPACFA
jgi:hypothetical protein